ncbi:MAG: branched-chain amino acid ABC transporter permease [Alphaproteobacteria bacterium]|nr:branched-chain amino acid ABC transporter permease [Alphaproteobacteria bacterium]
MTRVLCILIAVLALAVPFLFNGYVVSILIVTLYISYVGQAWNLLLGFGGQLSLGHALYTGLGAYLSSVLFIKYGISPWVSLIFVALFCAILGGLIGTLGFRFGLSGVHFTLLTIAFAECTRLLFEHWAWFGATAGLFIPVTTDSSSLWYLRGSTNMFYYLFLGLVIGAYFLCRLFLESKLGYFARAVRENELAASSLGINVFQTKVILMALSAAIASIGGVFFAFYQNSLFPDQTFAMTKSIEIVMGSIVGGIGTLIGPILGAFILIPLGELLSYVLSDSVTGIKLLFQGVLLLLMVLFLPKGLWPFLQKIWREKVK